ncbi:MAG: hypothetical protein NW207_05845 [Cytophagales bacterium]|nr:hypothetical protein [Cytophagales bacterium]
MNKIISTIIFAWICITQLLHAQDSTRKWSIAILPQHVIISGLRLDLEKRFNNSIHAINIANQLYLGKKNDGREDLLGAGIEISHKVLIDKTKSKVEGSRAVDFFFSYGPAYHYFEFKYNSTGWINDEIDGTPIITRGTVVLTDDIHRFSFAFSPGIVAWMSSKAYIECSIGMGIRYSKITQREKGKKYINSFLDYGYTGLYPVVLVKAGFLLF